MSKYHTLKWFHDRIGKRVFRLTDTHCCENCQRIYKEGLVISNSNHAHYLHIYQNEMGLKYADRKGKPC